MSVCGQTGNTENDCVSEEVGASTRDLHKQKPASKVVRVLTVLAYLLSVSLAAILLSVYYVCAWKSPEFPPLNHSEASARREFHGDFAAAVKNFNNFTGGSDTTVNGTITPQPTNIAVDLMNTSVVYDAATDPPLFGTTDPLTSTESLHGSTSDDAGSLNETNSIT